ncbi:MAG TPA: hypothetical protein ENG83_12635 [Nitrospirae bacterium]|nr:hypothetical protein [Nitrospirota bacterium]HDZ00576.1 hypothetical protein [Nitrospirota bacterium]
MEYNLITPPTFVIEGTPDSPDSIEAIKVLTGDSEASDELITKSLELYIRQMLSSNTLSLSIPSTYLPKTLGKEKFKKVLAKSLFKRIKFIDNKHSTWDAIKKYHNPIIEDIKDIKQNNPNERTPKSLVDELIAHVYSISLSIKRKSPAIIPPDSMEELIERLNAYSLGSESKARLTVLNGISNCFEKKEDIPVLVCRPNLAIPLADRIDEIMEDAYLLEVSKLRTFLSLESNWVSIKRDIRKILNFIIKNRSWAKNIVQIGTQTIGIPKETGAVIDALYEIGLVGAQNSCPVLIKGNEKTWQGESNVLQIKYPGALAFFPKVK